MPKKKSSSLSALNFISTYCFLLPFQSTWTCIKVRNVHTLILIIIHECVRWYQLHLRQWQHWLFKGNDPFFGCEKVAQSHEYTKSDTHTKNNSTFVSSRHFKMIVIQLQIILIPTAIPFLSLFHAKKKCTVMVSTITRQQLYPIYDVKKIPKALMERMAMKSEIRAVKMIYVRWGRGTKECIGWEMFLIMRKEFFFLSVQATEMSMSDGIWKKAGNKWKFSPKNVKK